MTSLARPVRVSAWRSYAFAPLAFGLGALLSQGLAPVHFLWGVPVALGGAALLCLRARSAWHSAWAGWFFAAGYFAFGLSWIIEPFQVDPDRHAWMAPFALLFLAGGLGLFWAAAFGLAARLGQGGWRLLALLALWPLAEFGRAYLLTGLPWAAFGQFWIGTPAALLLAWTGPHGLALLTLAAALPLGLLPRRPVLAIAPLLAAAGLLMLPAAPPAELTGKQVRLVQPNAPQHQKWDPDFAWGFVRRQLAFTAEGPRPDLIVWPETAIPLLLDNAGPVLQEAAYAAGGVPLVLGIQRRQDGRYYNSLISLDAEGAISASYDKAHLVPFGEYVPFGNLMARFGITGFAAQAGAGYAAGPGPQLLDLGPGLGRALPLICYEAVFPQDVNAAPGRADYLLQITNDAWFGTWSGPYQHLVQARMRAAEQGLPVIRAANTGISAMIGPYGEVLESLPLGEAGFADAALPAPLPPTLYSRTGDLPVFAVVLLLLGVVGWRRSAHVGGS